LPGKALVVYEPTAGVVSDGWPCADGHAQARSLVTAVLGTGRTGARWIADRHCCTREFRCDLDTRGASFVIRQHRGLPLEILSPLHPLGRVETGHIAAQRVGVVDAQGGKHVCRRLRLKRNHATRDGATVLSILTNLPARPVSAIQVARLYQRRWPLETAFQHLEAYFHSEINTLGYPKAALFGFCLALVAYNVLAVVLAALRGVHGQQTVDEEVSLYYLANEVATTYHGMMIAIPEVEWDVFYRMSASDMAVTLLDLAKRVNIRAFRKSPRGPKKPRPERDSNAKQGHVSTAKLLMARHG
jgi:hypothetical protein